MDVILAVIPDNQRIEVFLFDMKDKTTMNIIYKPPKNTFTGNCKKSVFTAPVVNWSKMPVRTNPALIVKPSLYPQGCFHIKNLFLKNSAKVIKTLAEYL